MSERPESPAFKLGGIVALVLAAGGVGALLLAREAGQRREARRLQAEVAAGPHVRTAKVRRQGGERGVMVQGEALPYASTTLYAKVSGFLKRIPVDKGSLVSAGQTVAVLESPETDRQTQALHADAENKRRNAQRAQALGREGLLSPQDVEQAVTAARVAEATLASQSALKGYEVVRAPFSGVVTQRFADPGALIQNGGTTASAQPLVTLDQVDRLRVSFYLDASVASAIRVGTPMEVRPVEHPEVVRTLKVSRVAGALDPKTRTLLAEGDLDNRDRAFLPGGFVQVTLKVRVPERLTLPEGGVVLRGGQPFAAVLQPDGRIRFQALTLGEDSGQEIQVLQGLQDGETVVLQAPADLKAGDRVQASASGF
ncbi:MAG TPA: efflux RND transporter periplasmic adaptor subunit [Holophagaceae bacterium]